MESQIVIIAAFAVNFLAIIIGVWRLASAVGKFEIIGKQQSLEISHMKTAMSTLSDLVTKLALSSQRQDIFAERLGRIEHLIDDLRRGEGWILPMVSGRPSGS